MLPCCIAWRTTRWWNTSCTHGPGHAYFEWGFSQCGALWNLGKPVLRTPSCFGFVPETLKDAGTVVGIEQPVLRLSQPPCWRRHPTVDLTLVSVRVGVAPPAWTEVTRARVGRTGQYRVCSSSLRSSVEHTRPPHYEHGTWNMDGTWKPQLLINSLTQQRGACISCIGGSAVSISISVLQINSPVHMHRRNNCGTTSTNKGNTMYRRCATYDVPSPSSSTLNLVSALVTKAATVPALWHCVNVACDNRFMRAAARTTRMVRPIFLRKSTKALTRTWSEAFAASIQLLLHPPTRAETG